MNPCGLNRAAQVIHYHCSRGPSNNLAGSLSSPVSLCFTELLETEPLDGICVAFCLCKAYFFLFSCVFSALLKCLLHVTLGRSVMASFPLNFCPLSAAVGVEGRIWAFCVF